MPHGQGMRSHKDHEKENELMYSVLAIVACLSGEDCQVHVLSDPVPQPQCMMWSQPAAAEWAGQHPNHKIDRVMCADPKQLDNALGRNQA